MKLIFSNTFVLILALLELLLAHPVPDEVVTKLSDNIVTLKKTTGIKLKPQLSKSPKQDEEEGGDYAGGLVDRLVGFGQSLFKEDVTLGKVFAGAATFIPGEAGNSVSNILNRIAAPFNELVEKPIQQVQEYILANQGQTNTTNLVTEKSLQPGSAVNGQLNPVAISPGSPQLPSNISSSQLAATAPVQNQHYPPVQTSVGIQNEVKPPTFPVASPVSSHDPLRHQIPSIENKHTPNQEINGEEDDEEDNEDEDNDIITV